MPDEVILRMQAAVKRPPVPLWHNPDKDRDEPNENDPDYLEAVKQYQRDLGLAGNNAILMYGAVLVSTPDGFPGPDDPEWLEERALARMSSGNGRMARWFDWLTLKAAPRRKDREALMYAIGVATGVMEADVDEASKSAGGDAG